MYLYNINLVQSSKILKILYGNFLNQKELVILKKNSLELAVVDKDSGKLVTLHVQKYIQNLKNIVRLRLIDKDYLVCSSDAGNFTVLEYKNDSKIELKILHNEPYGKSGMRRNVPGEYIAVDPKGRAAMIAAVEKQKFVYLLNRDKDQVLISSPLEASKQQLLCFAAIALDVGYENPLFCCLEFEFAESDEDYDGTFFREKFQKFKLLNTYEVDLGLNHVVRRWSCSVLKDAHHLISIPGSEGMPGGLLICCGEVLIYKNRYNNQELQLNIPKRKPSPTYSHFFTCSVVHRLRKSFFVLIHNDLGDVFKITIDYDQTNGVVLELKLKYFDTIPVSSSLAITDAGFLLCGVELGSNFLFQIESLGENDPEFSSNDMRDDDDIPYYVPGECHNLALISELSSSGPFIDAKVLNLTQADEPQIYAISGRGPNSTFDIISHGITMNLLVDYPLPGTPSAVWAIKRRYSDLYQSYIIISFVNATLVLSIGETVDEVTDSGFILEKSSLLVAQMGDDGLLQVFSSGFKFFRESSLPNGETSIMEWKCMSGKKVTHASCNNRQLLLVLNGNELVYFELSPQNLTKLNEFKLTKKVNYSISCVSVAPIPDGRLRSKFLAVGCSDQIVRLHSLDTSNCLEQLGMQALNGLPKSVLFTIHGPKEENSLVSKQLMLNVGLENGILMKTVVDPVTGSLSDTRNRFLGTKAIRSFFVTLTNINIALFLSSRTWFSYFDEQENGKMQLVPSSYESELEYVSSFISEQCPSGIIAVSGSSLRILTVSDISAHYNTKSIPLERTPKKFLYDPYSKQFIILESDHNPEILTAEQKSQISSFTFHNDDSEEDENEQNYKEIIMAPKLGKGKWETLVRLIDPFTGETKQRIVIEGNEAGLSLTACVFFINPTCTNIIVGTAKNLNLQSRYSKAGYLYTFVIGSDKKLSLVHKTEIDQSPTALCPFQGRLLVGLGPILRIYELGKLKLLRKTEARGFPTFITNIQTQGDRIYVSDVQESIIMARYLYQENKIAIFADDIVGRYVTRFTVLDYNTVAAADKFGNFFVLRLRKKDIEEIEEDPTGTRILHEQGKLNGAPKKLEQIANYYIGDTITSLQRCTLIAGAREILLYTTISGTIGLFIPLSSAEDVEFFEKLQYQMANEIDSLTGRDNALYRSYYLPVKRVIDGNFVEEYCSLPQSKKLQLSEKLERSITEITRQIELVRARIS